MTPADKRAYVADFAVALLLGLAGFAMLAHVLAGCTFARVRYVDRRAADAALLVCQVDVNTLVCREYFSANKEDGVQLVPANSRERVDM